ncbi:MAG: hypothetical protein WA855_09245 [Candidatus Acidiferrales bacterium]
MRFVKKWWSIAVIIAVAVCVIGWKESRCERQERQCRAYYAAQEARLFGFSVDSNAAEQEAISAACEPGGYFCRLFSAANLPAVLLVFLGIGGIWAALKTLNVIKRQTRSIHHQAVQVRKQTPILRDSARAALLNAQAVINNERPWVMLEVVQPDEGYWNIVVLSMTAQGKPIFAVPNFRNYGNTPAWIVRSTGFLKLCDDRVIETAIDYGNPPLWTNPHPLPPKKDGSPLMLNVEMDGGKVLNPQDIRALLDGDMYLLLYGFVEYRDPFFEQTEKLLRTTKFSYRFYVLNRSTTGNDALGRWGTYGPQGANEHT